MMNNYTSKNFKFPKIKTVVILLLALILIIRLTLPLLAKNLINHALQNKLENYIGHIEDIDLAIWRGAYQIEGLSISKRNIKLPPLLEIKRIDISIAWRKIFEQGIKIDIEIIEPYIRLVNNKEEDKAQFGTDERKGNWLDTKNYLAPLSIVYLIIKNGKIDFTENSLKTPLSLNIRSIFFSIKDIDFDAEKNYSPVKLTAYLQDQSQTQIYIDGNSNILKSSPNYNLNFKLENFNLVSVNKILRAYIPIDFTRGNLSIYGEILSNGENISGYTKVFLKDHDIIASDQEFLSPKHFVIELATGFFAWIIKNRESIATKIPFERKDGKWDIDGSEAFWSSLENKSDQIKQGIENKY